MIKGNPNVLILEDLVSVLLQEYQSGKKGLLFNYDKRQSKCLNIGGFSLCFVAGRSIWAKQVYYLRGRFKFFLGGQKVGAHLLTRKNLQCSKIKGW